MGIELAPLMAKTDAGYAGGLEKCVDFFQRNSLDANQIAISKPSGRCKTNIPKSFYMQTTNM